MNIILQFLITTRFLKKKNGIPTILNIVLSYRDNSENLPMHV